MSLQVPSRDVVDRFNALVEEEIVGQHRAVDDVRRFVTRYLERTERRRRGSGALEENLVLFFAGPSGVGKSHLAKTVAKSFHYMIPRSVEEEEYKRLKEEKAKWSSRVSAAVASWSNTVQHFTELVIPNVFKSKSSSATGSSLFHPLEKPQDVVPTEVCGVLNFDFTHEDDPRGLRNKLEFRKFLEELGSELDNGRGKSDESHVIIILDDFQHCHKECELEVSKVISERAFTVNSNFHRLERVVFILTADLTDVGMKLTRKVGGTNSASEEWKRVLRITESFVDEKWGKNALLKSVAQIVPFLPFNDAELIALTKHVLKYDVEPYIRTEINATLANYHNEEDDAMRRRRRRRRWRQSGQTTSDSNDAAIRYKWTGRFWAGEDTIQGLVFGVYADVSEITARLISRNMVFELHRLASQGVPREQRQQEEEEEEREHQMPIGDRITMHYAREKRDAGDCDVPPRGPGPEQSNREKREGEKQDEEEEGVEENVTISVPYGVGLRVISGGRLRIEGAEFVRRRLRLDVTGTDVSSTSSSYAEVCRNEVK